MIAKAAYRRASISAEYHLNDFYIKHVMKNKKKKSSGGDFLTSAVVGAATGSTLLGLFAGGSLGGALLGDGLEGGGIMDDPDDDEGESGLFGEDWL